MIFHEIEKLRTGVLDQRLVLDGTLKRAAQFQMKGRTTDSVEMSTKVKALDRREKRSMPVEMYVKP